MGRRGHVHHLTPPLVRRVGHLFEPREKKAGGSCMAEEQVRGGDREGEEGAEKERVIIRRILVSFLPFLPLSHFL